MCIAIFAKSKQTGSPIVEYFSFTQNITVILVQSVQLLAVVGAQRPDTVRSCTGFPEFDEELNELKERALAFSNAMVEHMYNTSLVTRMPSSPLFVLCKTLGPLALFSLVSLCVSEHDQLEKLLDKGITADLVVEFLKLLCNMLEDNNFYVLFSANKEKIVVDIVLTLLRTTLKEKGLIVADPENFVTLALDTCDKQTSDIPKTEAAKLLESLCDHIDGCLTFVTGFCCDAIRHACKGAKPELLANFPFLAPFGSSSAFLMKSSVEALIETSIVAMTDISYLTPRRHDVLYLMV